MGIQGNDDEVERRIVTFWANKYEYREFTVICKKYKISASEILRDLMKDFVDLNQSNSSNKPKVEAFNIG